MQTVTLSESQYQYNPLDPLPMLHIYYWLPSCYQSPSFFFSLTSTSLEVVPEGTHKAGGGNICMLFHLLFAQWHGWQVASFSWQLDNLGNFGRAPHRSPASTNDNIGMWEHAFRHGVGRKTAVTHFPSEDQNSSQRPDREVLPGNRRRLKGSKRGNWPQTWARIDPYIFQDLWMHFSDSRTTLLWERSACMLVASLSLQDNVPPRRGRSAHRYLLSQ